MTDDILPFDSSEFRRVLGHFPTGVTIVATDHGGKATGLAVGSFFSVSLDPPLIGFCVGNTSASWAAMRDSGHFVVNVLADDQGEVSGRFAGKSDDKFAGIDWTPSPVSGSPRISGCVAHLDCTTESILPGGDHEIVIGRVHALDVHRGDAGPLLFFKGSYGRFGELG